MVEKIHHSERCIARCARDDRSRDGCMGSMVDPMAKGFDNRRSRNVSALRLGKRRIFDSGFILRDTERDFRHYVSRLVLSSATVKEPGRRMTRSGAFGVRRPCETIGDAIEEPWFQTEFSISRLLYFDRAISLVHSLFSRDILNSNPSIPPGTGSMKFDARDHDGRIGARRGIVGSKRPSSRVARVMWRRFHVRYVCFVLVVFVQERNSCQAI